MALIDVSDILSDPDFIDPMQVIDRVPTTNSRGEVSFAETIVDSFGSVQPASGETVEKLPEAMRVANIRSFWYRGAIVASSSGHYSSILVFKGKRYQVQTVDDWSNWGSGWTQGTCVAEVPA